MYAYAAMNLCAIIFLCIAAMITAFTLPPIIPALFSALVYIPLSTHLFIVAADNDGDYRLPIFSLFKVVTWLILVFSVIYWKNGLIREGTLQIVPFIDSLYFSISAWTTLVYGDLLPPDNIRLVASVEALLGYVGMGLLISSMGLWISKRTEIRKSVHDHNRALIKKHEQEKTKENNTEN